MTHSSARSATADTGKTVLALVAIFSLFLSLFAIVSPVVATHTEASLTEGDKECQDEGFDFGFKLDKQPDEGTHTYTTADGTTFSVTLTRSGRSVSFSNASIPVNGILVKGGDESSGGGTTVVAFEPPVTSGGPFTPPGDQNAISHVTFCFFIPPEISVEKTGDALSKVTDDVTFIVTVTNDSADRTAYLQSLDDSLQGDLTDPANIDSTTCGASLAPGASCTVTYTYTVDAADVTAEDQIVNEVTAVYRSRVDLTGGQTTVTDTHTVELFQPSLTVDKTATPAEVEIGDDVNYVITITNTSSMDSPALVVDAIDDTLAGDLSGECPASLAAGGDPCVITYTLEATAVGEMCNTVTVETNPDGFPNEIDGTDTACVNVVETPPVLGSITINKEVDCEECVTRTPGFWFNAAGSHDGETNELMAELAAADGGDPSVIEVNIDGTVYEFATADDVRAFIAADTSGDWDDENGLSRDGALLRHYLSTWLNVALNGDECDLLSRELNGQPVEDILAEAAAALEADDEEAEVAALEKLTAINESDDADENPLTCGDSGNTSGDGFMFELFAEADFPDGEPIDSGTTGDDGPGTLVFDELPLGTYVLVETGNDSEQECEIVSVEGGILNEDGTVTVEITLETPDVVLTIVNECEGGEGEENPGDITVIKEAGDDAAAEFAFSASWDGDGFVLSDEESEFSGDLEAGQFTVTETLTPEQIAAGWTLVDIDCGDADVSVVGSTVTITLGEDEHVTCTFTNELEEEENGLVEIDKLFCFTDEAASTEFFVFGPSPMPELNAFGEAEEEMPEEGCWTEAVSFTITGGDLEEPLEITTDENGIWEELLPASENAYVITEDMSGESAEFFVEDGAITTIAVLNLVPEDEAGLVKVIKLFCEGDEASVEFIVEGNANADVPVISGCEVGDATFELGDLEITTEDGIAIHLVDAGAYAFAEVDPNEATYNGTITVVEGEITSIIVINTFVEGENPGEGGPGPGQGQTPRENTAGGNPLPNTATSPIPTGSVPAALLALLMLAGLGAASYAVRAEAQRRR